MKFDAKKESERVVDWIKSYMKENGKDSTPVVIGLSGGKDSTITAAACVKALGKDRVIGVSMPDGLQTHDKADMVANELGIKLVFYSIKDLVLSMYDKFGLQWADWGIEEDLSNVVEWNHPARLRMTVLYMIANQIGGRVANTCNMSETYVGYDTRWGDQCGDFSPFQEYTASEVKAIGRALGVPDVWVDQVPSDGMCGLSDEQRWGFTYEMLDAYLRGSEIPDDVRGEIVSMHNKALYKIVSINLPRVTYQPDGSFNLYT